MEGEGAHRASLVLRPLLKSGEGSGYEATTGTAGMIACAAYERGIRVVVVPFRHFHGLQSHDSTNGLLQPAPLLVKVNNTTSK